MISFFPSQFFPGERMGGPSKNGPTHSFHGEKLTGKFLPVTGMENIKHEFVIMVEVSA